MIYQLMAYELPYRVVAENLGVDTSTVCWIVQLFRRTGSVSKKEYNKANIDRKITDTVQFFILQLILDCPGIYLYEIQSEVKLTLELDLGLPTLCLFLSNHGFYRQKMKLVAKQRDEILCARFASEVSIYAVDIFVFLDEIGTDRRDILRRYGYSWRGMPAKANKLLVRGEHLAAVAFMSTTGVLDCKITHQTINVTGFEKSRLPHTIINL